MISQSSYQNLAGKFLLSTVQMRDVRFYRAVIYICSHDANGAMGLVINHPGAMKIEPLLQQLKLKEPVLKKPMMIFHGGPVGTDQIFILHHTHYKEKTTRLVSPTVAWTTTKSALMAACENKLSDSLIAIGYAGWGAGQLEAEMQRNTWFCFDEKDSFLFEAKNITQKWSHGMNKIGINPAMFVSSNGHS